MAGKIDYSALNVKPYPHELAIAELFAQQGEGYDTAQKVIYFWLI